MKSIKSKFTIFFTITVIATLLLFSTLVFSTNLVSERAEINEQTLRELTKDRPTARRFLERVREYERFAEIGQIVNQEALQRANRTVLILTPILAVAGAIAAYILSSFLVAPIEKVSAQIRKLGSKNLDKRLEVDASSTEVDILVNRVNQLLDELEEAFKVQEQFVGDVAHELRTPLAAIKAQIQVHSGNNKKESQKLISTVEKLNNEMIVLNEKLLFLNRSNSRLGVRELDLGEAVEEVVESISAYAKGSGVKIDFSQPQERISYAIEPNDLSQIMRNLLENSIKYSNRGQTIQVEVRQTSSQVILEVIDEGIGIPKESLERIFDRFYRGANARSLSVKGEGLGLSIVAKVVKAYGGSIEVQSELDKGTKVIVSLPK